MLTLSQAAQSPATPGHTPGPHMNAALAFVRADTTAEVLRSAPKVNALVNHYGLRISKFDMASSLLSHQSYVPGFATAIRTRFDENLKALAQQKNPTEALSNAGIHEVPLPDMVAAGLLTTGAFDEITTSLAKDAMQLSERHSVLSIRRKRWTPLPSHSPKLVLGVAAGLFTLVMGAMHFFNPDPRLMAWGAVWGGFILGALSIALHYPMIRELRKIENTQTDNYTISEMIRETIEEK